MQTGKKEIDSGKKTIVDVFKEWYSIPSYQRHYVWETDNVNDMLSDFQENYIDHNDEEYFLGSYIIQSKVGNNDLLDGQQRITTLFLLFAFLRDYSESSISVKNTCKHLVLQEENLILRLPKMIRLSYEIRGGVNKFIEEYIEKEGSIIENWEKILLKSKDGKECLSIRRMCNTLICFKNFFEDNSDINIDFYLSFILNNVVMIYISTDSLEDAFRLFSIMNDRGQKLNTADILKSKNLEAVPENDINTIAREWEEMQDDLGDDFDRFLAFVRTLLLKKRQRAGLLDEYDKLIFKPELIKKGKLFFDFISKTYSHYNKYINLIDNQDVEYCNLIRMLLRCMTSTDWIPLILAFSKKFGTKRLNEFTHKIACKNIADTVCGIAPTKRIDNLNLILEVIDKATDVSEAFDNEDLYAFDQQIFMVNIRADVYGRNFTKALLMLLEFSKRDKSEWKEFGTISIEHILPRNPKAGSKWTQDFSEEERQQYTHKIGNLCFIGRKTNSKLSNYDYSEKLEKYFKENMGAFVHTQYIYQKYNKQWTPKEFIENQQNVINDLMKIFNISKSNY